MLVRLATCGRYMLCSSDDKVDNFLLRNLETLKELQHLLQRQRRAMCAASSHSLCLCGRNEVSNQSSDHCDSKQSVTMKVCFSFETKLSVRTTTSTTTFVATLRFAYC